MFMVIIDSRHVRFNLEQNYQYWHKTALAVECQKISFFAFFDFFFKYAKKMMKISVGGQIFLCSKYFLHAILVFRSMEIVRKTFCNFLLSCFMLSSYEDSGSIGLFGNSH